MACLSSWVAHLEQADLAEVDVREGVAHEGIDRLSLAPANDRPGAPWPSNAQVSSPQEMLASLIDRLAIARRTCRMNAHYREGRSVTNDVRSGDECALGGA
jgi:hypothetical protein